MQNNNDNIDVYRNNSREKYRQELIRSGKINEVNASVFTYFFFTRYTKPISELVKIISMTMIGVLDDEKVYQAIEWMISKELAYKEKIGPPIYEDRLVLSEEWAKRIEKLSGISGIANKMNIDYEYISNHPDVNFTGYGPVGRGENTYATLISWIQTANKTIKYAMLSTSAYGVTVETLKKLSNMNTDVKIQLLIANENISKKYKQKKCVVKEWADALDNIKNVEIRTFSDERVIELCSSILIDDRVLQMNIYDPRSVRSLEGYLIEVSNAIGQNINIINWYKDKFDKAWDEAGASRVSHFLKRHGILILSIIAMVISLMMYLYSEDRIREISFFILGVCVTYIWQRICKGIGILIQRVKNAKKE